MNPTTASLVYVCGIAVLFYLNRDKSIRTSKALWLPVFYLWIIGSRPISAWLGVAPPPGTDVQLDGSPLDRAVFLLLLLVAICVLARRGGRTLGFISANFPILIYFFFCLLSAGWSDYPGVALKRWIKAIGDVAMILIVITDEQPVTALRRLFFRIGFILMPISWLFIKYYPALGRTYDEWTGAQFNTGAATDKNMLGVITFVVLVGVVWSFLSLLQSGEKSPHRRRQLLAQGTLLVIGVSLLFTSNSVTSTVCFFMGAGLMLATSMQFLRRNKAAIHVLVVLLAMTASTVMLLGGKANVIHALGRNTTLSGRTEIWRTLIPMAPNPLVGAGFESFWLSPQVHQRIAIAIPGLPLTEAHDGYVETYLQLGFVGLCLIAFLLIDGYRRSVKAFRRDPQLGGLLIAYVLTAMVYSVTEAGFRMMDPIWIFFLLASVEASAIAARGVVGASQAFDAHVSQGPKPARNALAVKPIR